MADLFAAVRARLAKLITPNGAALSVAAARIKRELVADATSKRGNVPSYAKFGDIPIDVKPVADGVSVTAADWVMSAARKYDEPSKWAAIAKEEVTRGH